MAENAVASGADQSLFSTPLPMAASGDVVVPPEVCARAGLKPGFLVCARVIGPGRILLVAATPDRIDSAKGDASQAIEASMAELARNFEELES
ncbi:MAG: hypothetical protein PHI63_04040 [Patescibacteria group bacterium]|nr:hypothetical protein [Patescibacteria group bacterium]